MQILKIAEKETAKEKKNVCRKNSIRILEIQCHLRMKK